MKKISDRLYRQIDTMIERGARDSDIHVRLPNVSRDEIEQVRRTRGNATPQTKAKMKPDPLILLKNKGSIDNPQIRAAEHIRFGYVIVTRDVRVKTASLETKIDIIGKKATTSLDREIRIEMQYRDWHEECVRRKIWVVPVIHLLTDYVTLKEIDYFYHKRKGWTKATLIAALNCYCDLFKP